MPTLHGALLDVFVGIVYASAIVVEDPSSSREA
jgi:hypothetical protein